jgi:hypothetical protein
MRKVLAVHILKTGIHLETGSGETVQNPLHLMVRPGIAVMIGVEDEYKGGRRLVVGSSEGFASKQEDTQQKAERQAKEPDD